LCIASLRFCMIAGGRRSANSESMRMPAMVTNSLEGQLLHTPYKSARGVRSAADGQGVMNIRIVWICTLCQPTKRQESECSRTVRVVNLELSVNCRCSELSELTCDTHSGFSPDARGISMVSLNLSHQIWLVDWDIAYEWRFCMNAGSVYVWARAFWTNLAARSLSPGPSRPKRPAAYHVDSLAVSHLRFSVTAGPNLQ
jgi:hypothetical protein